MTTMSTKPIEIDKLMPRKRPRLKLKLLKLLLKKKTLPIKELKELLQSAKSLKRKPQPKNDPRVSSVITNI